MIFKKQNEVVVCFDATKNGVSIVEFFNGKLLVDTLKFYPCVENEGQRDFISNCLQTFFDALSIQPLISNQFHLVVPSKYITGEFITTPNINKSQMAEAIKVELKNLYSNYDELEIHSQLIGQNKQTQSHYCHITNRLYLENIYKQCSQNRLYPQNILSSATALANAVLFLKPRLKKEDAIIVNIKENSTNICVLLQGQCFGGTELNYGSNILFNKKGVLKSELSSHDIASEFLLSMGNLNIDTSNIKTKIKLSKENSIKNSNINILIKQILNTKFYLDEIDALPKIEAAYIIATENIDYNENNLSISNLFNVEDVENNLNETLELIGAINIQKNLKSGIF